MEGGGALTTRTPAVDEWEDPVFGIGGKYGMSLSWVEEDSMSEATRRILAELKRKLASIYGERLFGVYVFGSYARDDADEESDLDILIVLDQVESYVEEISRTSDVISDLSLRHGVAISRVFASAAQWREDSTLFFLNLREEAIPA
jgi:predicted nucleotidyltransferase